MESETRTRLGEATAICTAVLALATASVAAEGQMAGVPGNDPRERALLSDVPAVGFGWSGIGRPGENEPFPACLRAVLRHAGESPACRHQQMPDRAADECDCAYRYIMAATGMAFFALWNAEEWDYASSSINVLAPDALEPFRRGLEAVALPYEIIGHEALRGTDGVVGAAAALRFETYVGSDELRRRIVESIAVDGRPVIAFGVVGPLECCLVTGFDESGDVLIGWNFFQAFPKFAGDLEFEPTGQFRRRDWEEGTLGIIVVGDRGRDAPVRKASRDALKWAVELASRPTVHGRHAGLAAFQAYADTLRDDGRFPPAGTSVSEDCAFAVGDALQVHRRRHAADFVSQMAADEPDAAGDLFAAAESYRAVADTMEQVRGVMGGEEQRLRLADPDVRGRMADLILQARDHEAAAIASIEKALAALEPAEHYVAADEVRPELRNLLNFGTGVYAAPGLAPADQATWAATFDLPAAERAEAVGWLGQRCGCTYAIQGDAVYWLNGEGTVDALFYFTDQRDLAGIRRFLDLLQEAGSPLAFIVIRCEGIYDVLSFQPDWYIRHNNQLPRAVPDIRFRDESVRQDLLHIDWTEVWFDAVEQCSLPPEEFAAAHAELAAEYGCTQKEEDGFLVWLDEDGARVAMFSVCEDTDLDTIRRLYAALDETDCPLAWVFLHLTHWQEPVFEILSFSRDHWMAHRNRIGKW